MNQIVIPRMILTVEPSTGEVHRLIGQAVAIAAGTITDLGPADELIRRHPGAAVQQFPDRILTPGFVNSHHHVGITPFQLGVPDSSLETWIAARIGEPPVDLRLDTLYSAIQMIRSGVTTVQHVQGWYPTDAVDLLDSATEVVNTYREIGMRASFSKMIRDQNLLIHADDKELASALPASYRQPYRDYLQGLTVPLDDQLQLFDTLRAMYSGDPRIAIQLAPANFHWTSDTALERISAVAAECGVPLHMHLLETTYQYEYMRERTSGLGVRYLGRFGLLNERLTLGHGTWLKRDDIDALAETGVHVCHNCSSNFRLSSGRAPVTDLVSAGVNVAIGMDEAGINDDRDMLQEMRLVFNTNRDAGILGRKLSAGQVLGMATFGGARTTSFGPGLGTIAVGAPADLVLFDIEELNFPYQQEGVSEEEILIQRGREKAITDVMIAGAWVMSKSTLLTVNEQEVMQEIRELFNRTDRGRLAENRALSGVIESAVSDFFTIKYKA